MSVASDLISRLTSSTVLDLAASVKYAKDRYERCLVNLPKAAADIDRIEAAGLLTPAIARQISTYCVGTSWSKETLRIERSDLPAWRKIGKLTATGRDFDHHDDESGKDYVCVTVDVDGLERFRLEYVRAMPTGGRCRVTETVSRSLTCSLS